MYKVGIFILLILTISPLAGHGKYLPAYVTKEFEAYLKCGRLEHGYTKATARTGAVTLIQCFGSSLN